MKNDTDKKGSNYGIKGVETIKNGIISQMRCEAGQEYYESLCEGDLRPILLKDFYEEEK